MKRLLEKLCVALTSNFHFINDGGCCVVAGELSKYIPDCRVIVVNDVTSTSLDAARESIKNPLSHADWNKNDVHFWHVAVEFTYSGRKYIVDSDGVYSRLKFRRTWKTPLEGCLTSEEAVSLGENGRWNPMFDRRQIPNMSKMIKEHLECPNLNLA